MSARELTPMLSPFKVNQTELQLSRFPVTEQAHSNGLQAWDAADEYLLSHVQQQIQPAIDSKILVFNDSFGALTLNLLAYRVSSVTDSYLSQQGLLHNLAANQLTAANLQLLTSLEVLPKAPELILLKIPKSNALLIEQLCQISQIAEPHTKIIAAARAKDIHSSTLKLFEQYLGKTHTSLAIKKARLVFVSFDKAPQVSPYPNSWPLEHSTFTISNHANVFAREKLDLGARLFRQHLPSLQAGQQVIDLGCGNGVIGLSVLAKQPKAYVQFIDESFMAIASTQHNISQNLPEVVPQCQFNANDCLTGIADNSVDVILCNPPFHQLQAITDHIAWQMFHDSLRVLKSGGELRIIGNRQLGYHAKLRKLFGRCTTIASDHKFVILSAIKA